VSRAIFLLRLFPPITYGPTTVPAHFAACSGGNPSDRAGPAVTQTPEGRRKAPARQRCP